MCFSLKMFRKKKKKTKGSVVQGRNAIFVFKLFQIYFEWEQDPKTKSKK